MGLMAPFKSIYDDACRSILLHKPADRVLLSVPNEFLQPDWSSHRVKLLIDVERLCDGLVAYEDDEPHTHKLAGRFRLPRVTLPLCFLHGPLILVSVQRNLNPRVTRRVAVPYAETKDPD